MALDETLAAGHVVLVGASGESIALDGEALNVA